MSLRGNDWIKFQVEVYNHIENYCVPQYGDKPDDQCSEYSPEEFLLQVKRYLARQGKNSRPGQDELDLLKMAHYVQMAYTLIQEKKDAEK